MTSDTLSCAAGTAFAADRVSLNVVLAYEDFPTGLHALHTFDLLFLKDNERLQFDTRNVWKFDLLGISRLRQIAAAEAAGADLVIVSAHGPDELPPTVKRWMEDWVGARPACPGALVVMLDGAGSDLPARFAMESFFESCARRAGMDYFIQKAPGRHALERADFGADTGRVWRALEILTDDRIGSDRMLRPEFKTTPAKTAALRIENRRCL
jgi:hypothetical protein